MTILVLAVGLAILGCFAFSKDLIMILENPVKEQGFHFLQLAPGEFFFTTLKVSGYYGLLLGSLVILYEIIAFVVPDLTRAERRFLGPIVLGSSVLFYASIMFSYFVLTLATLTFFVNYVEGVVESLWSINQYFEFVLILMFSSRLSF
ncbi:Sec-independent protein translocase protein TATC chloroplastic, partial [Bienertia sinuspersici]